MAHKQSHAFAEILFRKLDRNKDGKISLTEWKETIVRLDVGLQPQMVEDMFNEVDRDFNKTIELQELKDMLIRARVSSPGRRGRTGSFTLSPTSSRDGSEVGTPGSGSGSGSYWADSPGLPASASATHREIREFCKAHGLRDMLKKFDKSGKAGHTETEFLAMLWRKQLGEHRRHGRSRVAKSTPEECDEAVAHLDQALQLQKDLKQLDQKGALVALLTDAYRQKEIDKGRSTKEGRELRGTCVEMLSVLYIHAGD